MCGIAGFTRYAANTGDEAILQLMGDAIRHRGPDANASYLDDSVGLHHRRLAIIDLSEAGNQPMHSECGRYVIVFNGEIYNFLELRAQLVSDGYEFRSQTDTEVILALFATHGKQCLKMLNGMFAFALWDKEAQKLLLARDRLGKKPLYYSHKDGELVFASELKSLLDADLIDRDVRLDALSDFFAYQYIPDPKTIFTNVYKLKPGHLLEASAGKIEIKQYWRVSFARNRNVTPDEAFQRTKNLIDDSVELRLTADVPLGAFLSGGIDSSGIVAAMSERSDQPVNSCAIGFGDPTFNETEFALEVARHCDTNHKEFTVKATVAESLPSIARFFDEPFADPSLVPTFFVSQLAREAVTVALAGDGGDEVFAGYDKYRLDAIESKWRSFVPNVFRGRWLAAFACRLQESGLGLIRKIGTVLLAISDEPAMAFYRSNAQITNAQWDALCRPEIRSRLKQYDPAEITINAYCESDGPDHLSRILDTDFQTYLPGDILVKVDRMSMANSLEVRAPLLDYRLVDFVASLGPEHKMVDGKQKKLLKQIFEPLLPSNILNRKKMGFSPPLARWMREDLREMAETRFFHRERGLNDYFEPKAIRGFWEEHQNRKRDHGSLLWSLLMFQLWWDEYMENG